MRPLKIMLLFCALVPLRTSLLAGQNDQGLPTSLPEIRAMEREIWALLNEERAFDNLPPLKLSPALSEVARKHSRDMAEQEELSHRLPAGKTLARRLADAGINYVEAGENIAFSETFMADFIHEHLIESPEHKENILDIDYQEVGVGIVYKQNKGYYITQDFLNPFTPQTEQDIQNLIRHNINIRRRTASLPPLDFLDYRERFAQSLSEHKANGAVLPLIPERFGETLVIFLMTPSLSDESVVFNESLNPRYDKAALGIWFARTDDYPGGAYFLTLLLFASGRHEKLSKTDQKQFVLSQINKLRSQADLKTFIQNSRLTEIAEKIATAAAIKRKRTDILFPGYEVYQVITYGTEDLENLPELLKSKVLNSRSRQLGIGLFFRKDGQFPQGAFWVTLIFE